MEEAVWAKLRYCPYWPAKIVETPPGLKKPARKFCVYFFGTNNYGFVEMDQTLSYLQHRSKYMKKWRGQKFREAFALCDEYIKNPTNSSHQVQKQILLAKEYEFEVKEEPKDDELWYSNEVVNLPTIKNCTNCVEKQTSIDLLTEEKLRLTAEVQRLKNESDIKSQEIYELKMALDRKETSHQMNIEEMNLKLLQCTPKNSNKKKNNEFEVECLLNHKIHSNGEQMFFVKWKGFNNRHNSWVKRSNLSCEKMLQSYSKQHKLR